MKVLFVSSGNSKMGISTIIKNQGESLIREGVKLEYFTIKGKGIRGYIKSIVKLKNYLKNNHYDVIHAHYSLSAFVVSLAGSKPLVVSLMGSDVKANNWFKWIIYLFNYFFWSSIIVKSKDMQKSLDMNAAHIIPNGVNMEKFKPIDKTIAIKKIGWDDTKKHILFAANPNRPVKNFQLAQTAFSKLKDKNLELHYLNNISNEMMPYYYNASDVILLTSLWEGSPNVIKEAMACNRPIISTDVGDVRETIQDTIGCYVIDYDTYELTNSIKKALTFSQTTGRNTIASLNEKNIAKQIIKIYEKVVK